MSLGFWGFSQKLFFHYFKWNSGGLGVSRRTAPTVRSYLQSFSRFGCTWDRKVHFSTFSGKLTFQSSRNGFQYPPYCPGSLQDTFIIYSSISHQHIFQKYCPTKNLENRKSENLKFQKPRFTNKCPEGTRKVTNHVQMSPNASNQKGSKNTTCSETAPKLEN